MPYRREDDSSPARQGARSGSRNEKIHARQRIEPGLNAPALVAWNLHAWNLEGTLNQRKEPECPSPARCRETQHTATFPS